MAFMLSIFLLRRFAAKPSSASEALGAHRWQAIITVAACWSVTSPIKMNIFSNTAETTFGTNLSHLMKSARWPLLERKIQQLVSFHCTLVHNLYSNLCIFELCVSCFTAQFSLKFGKIAFPDISIAQRQPTACKNARPIKMSNASQQRACTCRDPLKSATTQYNVTGVKTINNVIFFLSRFYRAGQTFPLRFSNMV